MSDPSYPIQVAIVSALKADAGVAAIISNRVYDTVPEKPQFPYVTLGDMQVLPDKADCIDGSELSIQIDGWSRAVGYPEVKRLGSAVVAALDDAEIPINGHVAVVFELQSVNYVRDPDGVTRHAIITFHALTEPA